MIDRGPILVGIDFSIGAAIAVSTALDFADRLGCPVRVLHVHEGDVEGWSPQELGWMRRVGLDPATVDARRGVPWIELSRLSSEMDAQLVVIGTHGTGGYQPVSMGKTATTLLARSTRPVLVVPGR